MWAAVNEVSLSGAVALVMRYRSSGLKVMSVMGRAVLRSLDQWPGRVRLRDWLGLCQIWMAPDCSTAAVYTPLLLRAIWLSFSFFAV